MNAPPALRTDVPHRATDAGSAVESLENGWHRLSDCRIGDTVLQMVVIQPGLGVVLLEVEPHWTADAIAVFRLHLQQTGFAAAYPGHLPVIHRRLRPQDSADLDFLLLDAFAWQDPIAVEGDAWDEALLRVLRPLAPPDVPPPATVATPRAYAPVAWTSAARPSRGTGRTALAVLALAGVVGGVVFLARPPGSPGGGAAPPPRPAIAATLARPASLASPSPGDPAAATPTPEASLSAAEARGPVTVPEVTVPETDVTAPPPPSIAPLEAVGSDDQTAGVAVAAASTGAPSPVTAASHATDAADPDPGQAGLISDPLPSSGAEPPLEAAVQTPAARLPADDDAPRPAAVPRSPTIALIALPFAIFAATTAPEPPGPSQVAEATQLAPAQQVDAAVAPPVTASADRDVPVEMAANLAAEPMEPIPEPADVIQDPVAVPPIIAAPVLRLEEGPPLSEAAVAVAVPAIADPPDVEAVMAAPAREALTTEALTTGALTTGALTTGALTTGALTTGALTPERAAPETPVAETPAPEAQAPEAQTPEAQTPEAQTPTAVGDIAPATTAPVTTDPAIPAPPAAEAVIAEAPAMEPAPEEPTALAPEVIPTAPTAPPPPAAATPASVAAIPPLTTAPALPRPSPVAPLTLAMLRRGEALFAAGDISGARRFFERAAAAGNAAAARAMAETYDPRVLAGLGVRGLVPDRAAALDWYRRAAALGATDVAARIATLEADP